MKRTVVAVVVLVLGSTSFGAASSPGPRVPLGLDAGAMIVPADNLSTPEKVALGQQIFFDPRWSKSKTVSCASCHRPEHGWSDPRRLSIRNDGRATDRRAPTVVNRAFGRLQQWTGARRSLEEQANKSSDSDPETVVRHLGAIPGYQEQFRRVFGTGVTAENTAKAIAAFERALLSGNSPYDRHRAGDGSALSPAARRGLALFEGRGRCVQCHSGSNFSDEGYHNIGVGTDQATQDLGRFNVTKVDVNRGAFKTPTLRDVAQRPPYMHDGSLATLREVVVFYNRGGVTNPWLSVEMKPLGLDTGEEADLVAFLEALTGEIDAALLRPPVLPAD